MKPGDLVLYTNNRGIGIIVGNKYIHQRFYTEGFDIYWVNDNKIIFAWEGRLTRLTDKWPGYTE